MKRIHSIPTFVRQFWKELLTWNIILACLLFAGYIVLRTHFPKAMYLALAGIAWYLGNYLAYELFLYRMVVPVYVRRKKLMGRIHSGHDRMRSYLFALDSEDEHYEVIGDCITYHLVGGDFYHHEKDLDGNYWFLIGDSSGHGYEAGLFAMMTMSRAISLIHTVGDPVQILEILNTELRTRQRIFPTMNKELYATMVIMKAYPDGRLEYSGLHPSAVVYRQKTDTLDTLESRGQLVGTVLDSKLSAKEKRNTAQLDPGDILMLYTDGLYEQQDQNSKYYGTKLYDHFLRAPKQSLRVIPEKIFSEVLEFVNNRMQDDMTMVLVRKK